MPAKYKTGQKIDHYQIIRLLGQGFVNHVYLAQDWLAQREVVLKFPNDEVIGGAAIFKSYQREAEIGKRLAHPAIQRHLNQGEQRSAEYLVLEYLQGRTLWTVMQDRLPLYYHQQRCCASLSLLSFWASLPLVSSPRSCTCIPSLARPTRRRFTRE